MTVVPFRKPEPNEPWLGGQGKCLACAHEWEAEAPVGTWQLECPNCETMRGVWMHPIGAQEGDTFFRCLCECEALTAYYRHGKFWLRCMSCGTDQTNAVFGE